MEFKNTTLDSTVVSEVLPICKVFKKAWFDSQMMSRVALITTSLTSPFAVFLNGLILLAVFKNPSLRKQANIFLIALVIVDFIKSAVASPMFIVAHALYQSMLQPSCMLLVIFSYSVLLLPSQLLLVSLNIERFISIKAPFWHRANIHKRILVKIAIAGSTLLLIFSFGGFYSTVFVYPILIINFGLIVATLVFAVLVWWELKKRNNQANNAFTGLHGYRPRPAKVCISNNTLKLSRNTPKEQIQHDLVESENKKWENEEAKQDTKFLDSPTIRAISVGSAPQVDHHTSTPSPSPIKEVYSNRLVENSSYQTPVSVVAKKDGEDHPLEDIETLGTTSQHTKQDEQKEENPNPITPSTRSLKALKSQRKAAKIATNLVLGFTFTGLIPISIIFAFHSFGFGHPVTALIPVLVLLSSLVNPVINIGINDDLRQACWRLITCC